MTTSKMNDSDKENLRAPRSEAPRTTVDSARPQENMLDMNRFDITDEKIDWRLD